ncbi:hypothetical protein KY319_04110 [Candidatus Woesearchaeota archaeon]|nr:hypothetical protein [Candidatus Woesearchaeota archaeon]
MDLQEAYRATEEPLYRTSINQLPHLESHARNEGLHFAWLCVAGVYARKGEKEKFIDAITKAGSLTDDKAVRTLSQNADAAYKLIQEDTALVDLSKRLFAQQITKHFHFNLTMEQIVQKLQGTKIEHNRNSVTLAKTNLVFQAYRFNSPEEELEFDDKIQRLKQICGTAPNHPMVINSGKENNVGWYLGIL